MLGLVACVAAVSCFCCASATIECTSSGDGRCEILTADHWCRQEGSGERIGCNFGSEISTASSSCTPSLAYYACPNDSPITSTGGLSVATNITVVASPRLEAYQSDLHVQWQDSRPNDRSIAGYEVLIRDDDTGYFVPERKCPSSQTKHVIFHRLGYTKYARKMILVRTLPYSADTLCERTASITLPGSSNSWDNRCLAFASNQDLCSSSQQHSMIYSSMAESEVQLHSRYMDNTMELLRVNISWRGRDTLGLGVVVALTDTNNSSLVGTNCTTPGRYPPCFIIREASGFTIQGLAASGNYKVNLMRFNATACSGFNPTHLLSGCGRCCLDIPIPSPVSVPPPTTTADVPTAGQPVTTSHDSHMTTLDALTAYDNMMSSEQLTTTADQSVTTSHDSHMTPLETSHGNHMTSSELLTADQPVMTPYGSHMTPLDQVMSHGDHMTTSEQSPTPTIHVSTIASTQHHFNTPSGQQSNYLIPVAVTAVMGVVVVAMAILAIILWRKLHPSPTKPSQSSPPHPSGLGMGIHHKFHSSAHPLLDSYSPTVESRPLAAQPTPLFSPLGQFSVFNQSDRSQEGAASATCSATAILGSPPHPPSSGLAGEHSKPGFQSSPTLCAPTTSSPAVQTVALHSTGTHDNPARATAPTPHQPPADASTLHSTSARTPQALVTLSINRSSAPSIRTPSVSSRTSNVPSTNRSALSTAYRTSICPPRMVPPLVPPSPAPSKSPSVLILYSPSVSEQERELILVQLVAGLGQYGISACCHDTVCVKDPCRWMEEETRAATAVLCVCNGDFQREWSRCPSNSKIPVVGLFKCLFHASVIRGDSLAKFATILLSSADKDCIPSLYLQGEPRSFMVDELEEITRFVQNMPSYATHS